MGIALPLRFFVHLELASIAPRLEFLIEPPDTWPVRSKVWAGGAARLPPVPIGHQDHRVTESLQKLLLELEQFGLSNDRAIAERPRRMLNVTRDTGEFLSVLVRATNARRVLLVVDNATSHFVEMAPFVALVSADAEFTTCTVPVGNGEFLATRGP